jgi:hypothetical protein
VGYSMGYYTIWLASVKRILVPFWELEKRLRLINGVTEIEGRMIGSIGSVVKSGEDALNLLPIDRPMLNAACSISLALLDKLWDERVLRRRGRRLPPTQPVRR